MLSAARLCVRHLRPYRRWILVSVCTTIIAFVVHLVYKSLTHHHLPIRSSSGYNSYNTKVLTPALTGSKSRQHKKYNPAKWLQDHSDITRFETGNEKFNNRPKAALISLVRNEELEGILQSMRQLEYHWNRRYNYPWIFFSEKEFTEEFKFQTTNATSAATSYHLIPRNHWQPPSHIDRSRYHASLSYLGVLGVGKGYLPSYRNMCRWNSGFFYLHPALASYSYYWRVEPDVHFFCDIPYDPFRFLRDNGIVYGFNMNILDDARSFASLWKATRQFISSDLGRDYVHKDADIAWLLTDDNDNNGGGIGEYNNCQFFSNFEIGSLDFFRSDANRAYFEYLDSEDVGGFYYERYGDAPIHTLSVALFAGGKDKMWYFRDIGYQHDIARHCPGPEVRRGLCDCETTRLDENYYKLVPMESPQRKPADSCLRRWLGGEWLEKVDGWDGDVERAFGGDGLGGYKKTEFTY